MSRRSPFARVAVWAFAFALVLKAAVPMLASASAALQGKALAEVCDVYGVATVALPGMANARAPDPHAHHHHHDAAPDGGSSSNSPEPSPHGSHGSEHCALTALLALSAPDTLPLGLPLPAPDGASVLAATGNGRVAAFDAPARWASRLRHGPPSSLS